MKQLWISIGWMILLSGCADPGPHENISPKPQTTAKGLLVTLYNNMEQGNTPAFLACFEANTDQYEALYAICETYAQIAAFKKQFISHYGLEAWADFNAEESEGEVHFRIQDPDWLEAIEAVQAHTFNQLEDKAQYPIFGHEATLIRGARGWLIEGESVVGDDYKTARTLSHFNSVKKTLDAFYPLLGVPNIKPEDINYEMGRWYLWRRQGKYVQEERFNVKELLKKHANKKP